MGHIGLSDYVGLLSRFYEKRDRKRDIPVKNGIPQIRMDKLSTVFDPAPALIRPVFGPVSVYPVKNENERENTVLWTKRDLCRRFSTLLVVERAGLSWQQRGADRHQAMSIGFAVGWKTQETQMGYSRIGY